MNIYRIRYDAAFKEDRMAYVLAHNSYEAENKLMRECQCFDAVKVILSVEQCQDVVITR